MSKLSDYLNAHIPSGWSKSQVVEALDGKIDRATVYRYLAGRHPQRPSEAVLEAFASGLPAVSMTELRAVVGAAVGENTPWVPTKEANRLNHAQRMALDAFIRATVGAQDESGTVQLIEKLLAERHPAGPTTTAGDPRRPRGLYGAASGIRPGGLGRPVGGVPGDQLGFADGQEVVQGVAVPALGGRRHAAFHALAS